MFFEDMKYFLNFVKNINIEFERILVAQFIYVLYSYVFLKIYNYNK